MAGPRSSRGWETLFAPYMLKVYRVKKVCDEAVEHVLKLKMAVFGLFTSKRMFVTSKVVLFGTPEIIS